MKLNKRLEVQIHKHFGENADLSEKLISLLQDVSESYNESEIDSKVHEQSVENNSNEMIELNYRLSKETEESRKAKDIFQSLFVNIEEVFFSIDMLDRKLLHISPACEKVYGHPAKSFYLNPELWKQMVVKEDIGVLKTIIPLSSTGKKFAIEYRINHTDGSIRWLETKMTPALTPEGNIIRMDGFTCDISERKNAEIELRESQNQIQTIFDAALDAVIIIDEQGIIIKWDNKAEHLFGWREQEVLGTLLADSIIPIQLREAHRKGMQHFLQSGQSAVLGKTIEVRALNKNNQEFDISLSICPSLVKNKFQFIGFARDITSKKKSEAALQLSEKRFRSLIENNEDVISLLDKDSTILYQSPSAERVLGFSFEERKESIGLNTVHPDEMEEAKILFANVLKNPGVPFPFQFRKIHKQGHYLWVEGTITNMFEDESVNAILANYRDITRRKQAELAALESENKYRELFETMADGVYKSSHEGKFIEVNPALVKMLGYDNKEELMSIDIKSKLYFETSDRDDAASQDETDGLAVFRLRKKDGSEIWVEDRGQYVSDANGNVLYHEGILRDVTKRIHTEKALAANELKFRSLIENSADMIGMMDATGKFLYVSPNVINKFGYCYEECFAMNIMDVIHPDDIAKAQTFMMEVFENPLKPIVDLVIRERCKDGKYIWAEGTMTNLLSLDGVNAIVANFRDITERKEQQDALENSNLELLKSNHELDKFVYSISHDLRAPLLSMKGIVSITAEETQEEMTGDHMQMLNESICRLDNFIGEILDYSRNARGELKRESIDFKDLINNITYSIKHLSNEENPIIVETQIEESGIFYCDKARLTVIMNNLIANAVHYHNPKVDAPFVKLRIRSDDNNTQIEVEDNGIGISEEKQSKIFEMFYRGSEGSIGSGLGLYIVKETIDKLKGEITVASTPGVGTQFKIKIPNLFYQ